MSSCCLLCIGPTQWFKAVPKWAARGKGSTRPRSWNAQPLLPPLLLTFASTAFHLFPPSQFPSTGSTCLVEDVADGNRWEAAEAKVRDMKALCGSAFVVKKAKQQKNPAWTALMKRERSEHTHCGPCSFFLHYHHLDGLQEQARRLGGYCPIFLSGIKRTVGTQVRVAGWPADQRRQQAGMQGTPHQFAASISQLGWPCIQDTI